MQTNLSIRDFAHLAQVVQEAEQKGEQVVFLEGNSVRVVKYNSVERAANKLSGQSERQAASLERFATSLRDSAIWETPKGCKVQWTAFGEGGCVDWTQYFAEYARLCPGVAVNIETIGGFQVEFPYLEASFWEAFPKKPAAVFARFLAVAKRGKAATGFDANNRDLQRGELERSIRFLRETIGLGTKA